ncbi:hypothetical protein [Acinetobacter haemolyticus]|uniref:hypothetical protein n=1 Tax=Acinetobacter haemolyticus TaxID=29430 RepID=UPI000DEA54D9|nr:hypothetical protein [Acinetobacter haemolyticus]WHR57178.1 hypothetical protein PGW89_12180 [Acinetobacter haemolyticus]
MNVERHVYTDEEAVELRTAHMLAKNIMGHSYPQNVIEAAEKRSEEDFERIVSGEVTREEIESELLLKWDRKVALQMKIDKLEKEFQEGQDILNNWKNNKDPFFERHKSCVEAQHQKLIELKKQLLIIT